MIKRIELLSPVELCQTRERPPLVQSAPVHGEPTLSMPSLLSNKPPSRGAWPQKETMSDAEYCMKSEKVSSKMDGRTDPTGRNPTEQPHDDVRKSIP